MSVRRQQRAMYTIRERLFKGDSLTGSTHGLTGHHVRLLITFSPTIAIRKFLTMGREAIDMHDALLVLDCDESLLCVHLS
jgi:hypothetical protein